MENKKGVMLERGYKRLLGDFDVQRMQILQEASLSHKCDGDIFYCLKSLEEGDKMKKMLTIFIFSVVLNLGIGSVSLADSLKGKIGIGLGNPYLSLKYGVTSKVSIEARGAFGSGITVAGGRIYYNFNPADRMVVFIGGEGDYVSFDTDDVSGKGYIGYSFIGGEYFISKRFTVSADIGAAYIDLSEKKFDLGVSGVEWIYNIGINLYLGGKKR